ncbi:MAG TPA: glucose-6-phosphate dehydrogenase (coenzyme-F420) [Chloroflexota bacterium]
MLQLGYKASAEQFGPKELLAFGIHAEARGFDSVAVSDHFQPWQHTNGHAPNAFVWLGALAARTQRVRIGTSVLTPTYRYHPSIVDQAAGTLGVLSDDRFFLGLGSGESLNEIAPLGIEWPGFKERAERLREAIDLMQTLWRDEIVSYEGKYYRTHKATIYDRPKNGVPIYVAAAGPTAAVLAGRVADGFICTSGKDWALYRDTLLPKLAEGAEKAGRDPKSIERMIEMKVSYDTDAERALHDTRYWAALALAPEDKVGIDDPREMEAKAATVADQAHRRWIVTSDPDEMVEKIKPYVDLGFDHLVFHAPGPDQVRFLDLFARDVLPRLRQQFS